MTTRYFVDTVIPMELEMRTELFGEKGPALVPLYEDGTTARGWGRDTFMKKYMQNEFAKNRALFGYDKGKHAVSYVMRASRLLCVDIDGKNGGFDHASELGYLPPTLAEISKSKNGYHVFYETDEVWDLADGFAGYRDQIGIVQGVDIRSTGCVYHKSQQRWNDLPLAKLPAHLHTKLTERAARITTEKQDIMKKLELDPMEVAMMQDEYKDELKKPIPAGKRNNTLFAIGSKMKLAKVPGWKEAVAGRASEVGLETEETEKLLTNIENYSV